MAQERSDIEIEEEKLARKTESFIHQESARRFFLAYIKTVQRQRIIERAEKMGLNRILDGKMGTNKPN